MAIHHVLAFLLAAAGLPVTLSAAGQPLWQDHQTTARLIQPRLSGATEHIVDATINGHLADWCGRTLPQATQANRSGLYIVVGDENNNPVVADLVKSGLKLDRSGLGPEGFQIITHETAERRFVVITADSPIGLKHGCQELLFYHVAITADGATIDWPLDVRMKPAFPYRGVYILPCWSAYDSLENWKRVLKFHSEITLNRNWFWLAGFPLIERYGGPYKDTDLADARNVNGLVELCRAEGMKFYIGGGWFTWHHTDLAAGSTERGVQWYLDMIDLLPGTEGIYLEPPGEGADADEKTWRRLTEAFKSMAQTIWAKRPEFEFAVAIGKFNDARYRKAIHDVDDKRIYWWWCWGDPLQQNALAEHPLILRWHTIVRMSDFHGSTAPPQPQEASLTGFATSYDPGQGFGNPWNGWGKIPEVGPRFPPRNVHPHTLPFFSHQYWFRERCWNLNLTDEAFALRLARRLFDADMPADSIRRYLTLARMCPEPDKADDDQFAGIAEFVERHAGRGTLRNQDTLARMHEAVEGIRNAKNKLRAKATTQPR